MQFTLKEEVIEQLKLVLESVSFTRQRNKDINSVSDYLSSPWGMTILDATLMRIQFIGEPLLSIDRKTNNSLFQNYPQIHRTQIPSLKSVCKQIIADLTSTENNV